MRNYLNIFPFHTFLFIPFVSLFLFAQNPEHVTAAMMPRTLLIGTGVSVLIFGMLFFFYKSVTRAGIAATLILLILFNYGVLYDLIEVLYYAHLWPFKNIHRYLIIFVVLMAALFLFLVARKVKTGYKINYFLNVLLILLTAFNGIKVIARAPDTTQLELIAYDQQIVSTQSNLPNLYYIILDGYANQYVLENNYHFSNDGFLNQLKQKGFYIADSARANYFSTVPSLCSTFNLNYLTMADKERLNYLRKNLVFKMLKNNGYTIYNLRSGYSVTNGFDNLDSTIAINTPNEFERSILKFTVFRLDDLFGFIQYKRLKSQFSKLTEVAELSKDKRFVFIHIVAPHPPYVFDENGNQQFNNKNQNNYWEPKENYIKQLKYLNGQILAFITNIIRNDKQAAIILQSDHGPWIQDENEQSVFNARAMILNAIRFPESNKNYAYRSVSSINTFRLFFKTYFDSTLNLLPDSLAGKEETMNSILFKERLE